MPFQSEIKPTIVNKTTVGAGLPVKPTAIPPIIIKKPSQTSYTSTSSWHSAREILKKKGITGIYSGFSLHLGNLYKKDIMQI